MSGKMACWNLCTVVLTVACSQFATADDATYRLAYQFEAGQFFHFELEDRVELTTQAGENQSRSFQHTQQLKSYRVVIADENGGAILEPIIEKVKMASQSGDKGIVSYDSTNKETPPKEFEKIAGTIGRALARFHVAANGKLVKVTMLVTDVPKDFSDAAEKADPSINFLIVFPEKPLKIGDKWSEKYDIPARISAGIYQPIQMIRTYELVSVTDNIASIKFRTSVLTLTNEREILRQLVQQTPRGTIEFDMEQGRILSKSLVINEKAFEAFGPQTLLQARGESIEKLVTTNSPPRLSNKAANPLLK